MKAKDASLGIVEALVGQTRMQFIFTGQANHAGTTPMHLRHDAMAAAAEWIVAVEAYANAHAGLVATVGKVETSPGAGNVIAGESPPRSTFAMLDDQTVRLLSAAIIDMRKLPLQQDAACKSARNTQLEQPAVPLDPHYLPSSCRKPPHNAGFPSRRMTSGAGHDAMIVARRVPSAMLFLRSPGGLSHHPDESVLPQDVEAALATAMEFLRTCAMIERTSRSGHA